MASDAQSARSSNISAAWQLFSPNRTPSTRSIFPGMAIRPLTHEQASTSRTSGKPSLALSRSSTLRALRSSVNRSMAPWHSRWLPQFRNASNKSTRSILTITRPATAMGSGAATGLQTSSSEVCKCRFSAHSMQRWKTKWFWARSWVVGSTTRANYLPTYSTSLTGLHTVLVISAPRARYLRAGDPGARREISMEQSRRR